MDLLTGSGARISVVLAHPDDETWLSGTIAKLASRHLVDVVYVTSGSAGSDRSGRQLQGSALAAERELEAKKASAILGAKNITFWRFSDGQVLPQTSLIEARLSEYFTQYQPDLVLTFDATGVTKHPDHIALSAATTQALSGFPSVKYWQVVVSKKRAESMLEVAAKHQHPFRLPAYTANQAVTLDVAVAEYQEQRIKAFKQHQTQFGQDMQVLWKAFVAQDLYEEFKVIN